MADIFEIVGKVSLDGVDKAEKELKGFSGEGEKSSSKLSKLGGIAKSVGKGLLVGAGAVTAGAVGLVKQVSSSYGALQQSIGGIETLFGKSAQKVITNANNAYTTAGISANEYMQQVTSFSASLLQSLGGDTQKACDSADMAIRDMADNANKMGTSTEMIQNAYQGFSKQNYTMLDNLKLGYGGTKSEMERLLKDAEKISGIKYDISNLNDVYSAIHVVQQELGITGTTAKEAGGTIEGSFNSLSASWQNFLAGLGDPNADMKAIVDNLAKGISGAVKNVIPIINNMVSVLPTVMDAIIGAVNDLAPTFIKTFTTLITQVINAIVKLLPTIIPLIVDTLKSVINTLVSNLPQIIDAVILLVTEVINALSDMLPQLIPKIIQALIDICNALIDNLPTILNAVLQLIRGVANGLIQAIPILIDALPQIINSIIQFLIDAVPQLIDASIQLFMALIDAIPVIIEGLLDALPQIINSINQFLIQSIPQLIEAGIKLLMALIEAIPVIIEAFVKALPDIITAIIDTLLNNIPLLIDASIQLFLALVEAIPVIVIELIKALPQIIWAILKGLATLPGKLKNFFVKIWGSIKNVFSGVGKWFGDIFGKAWNAIKSAWSAVTKFFSGIWSGIKNVFSAVGKWFGNIFSKAWSAIKSAWSAVTKFFSGIWSGIKNVFSAVGKWFGNIFSSAWNGIKSAWSGVTKFFSGLWTGIKNVFSGVGNWFKNIFSSAWNGIKSVFSGVGNFFKKVFGVIGDIIKAPINLVIKGLNFLISGLNRISFDVPDWVPIIGGKKFGFDIPKIPLLAKGGIVDKPTLAGIGEDGQEAVVPLEKNIGWIKTLAEKLTTELKSVSLSADKSIENVVSETAMKSYQLSFNTQFDALNDRVDRLIDLIGQYLPNIADNMDRNIVLDGNSLAVGISRKIDTQLGKISTAKGRGNV